MHWINRQSLLHSVRLLETIRVTPYLRSFHSTKVTQPKLNPELPQSRKPCQNLEVTPVRKKPLGKVGETTIKDKQQIPRRFPSPTKGLRISVLLLKTNISLKDARNLFL